MQDPLYVRRAFAKIAPGYVATNHVLSLGIDVLWRRRTVRELAQFHPQRILDVATGSGDLMAETLRQIPDAEVVGADFCVEMLEAARKRNLKPLLVADGTRLPFADASFDAVTVAFGLRNMESWLGGAREMGRVLRPGGALTVLDFSLPRHRLLRKPYTFYLNKILPRLAGIVSGHREPYEYLARSIDTFPSGPVMCDLLGEAGYSEVRHTAFNGGIASLYLARKP